MGNAHVSMTVWTMSLWCAAIFFLGARWFAKKRRPHWVAAVFVVATLVAIVPLLPLPQTAPPSKVPSQVIYRFDDHRWLELKGWDCEGALWYVDAKQGIRTEAAPQFYQIFFFTYVHPSTNYIAIPLDDLSAIIVSRDGGRTFHWDARFAFSDTAGPYSTSPEPEEVSRFVVVDGQGFLETKAGRLIESSKPFGKRWGMDYVDSEGVKQLTYYDEPQFQGLPTTIPEVKNYTGWTHMQCDPSVGTRPHKSIFKKVQEAIFEIETSTLGAPVFYGVRALS